ncbi:unnamed protein product [Symbiodinium natans]|uniref:Peptidase A1 domain-containing protein n=1 Tax=Symbiodinium natans TaxID=878477 RepID=A0A812I8B9_9DINO|nr:unnamed protein product [Symbiodinium natans]
MQGAFHCLILLLASSPLCQSRFLKRHAEELAVHDQETCSPLRNHETYSSVSVMVGTPPQSFDLVADTGSNNCIVMDCQCAQCPQDWGKCFTGKSKTFDLPKYKSKDPLLGSKNQFLPASMLLTFGSGQIAAHVASDEVRVGHTSAFMKNGLLLMVPWLSREVSQDVDQALRLQGPFEGILGLGRPEVKTSGAVNHTAGELDIRVPGYAEAAGVQRFSMCFNKEADGVLGLHTPEPVTRLESVGQIHWGVDFHGISIGEGQTRQKAGVRRRSLWLEVSGRCWWGQVKFCNPKDKKPDQESGAKVIRHFYAESCRDTIQADTRPRTICGLIPDSGTTMITGPESQLADLYMDICSSWSRCQKAFEEVSKDLAWLLRFVLASVVQCNQCSFRLPSSWECWLPCALRLQAPLEEMHDLQEQGMQVGGLSLTQHATVPEELADAFKKLQDVLQAGVVRARGQQERFPLTELIEGGTLEGVQVGKPVAKPIRLAMLAMLAVLLMPPLSLTSLGVRQMQKANVFLLLLEHCADWAEGVDLDKELPKLNFHVAGLNGAETELSLRPKTYIMTATAEIKVPEIKTLGGCLVCMPAFQPAPFTTKLNGEVWIMGTPLFYEYTAHYDRGSVDGKVKPSMAFTHAHEQPCGSCQDNRIVRDAHPSLTQKLATEVGGVFMFVHSKKSEKTGVESLRQLTKAPIVRNLTSTHSLLAGWKKPGWRPPLAELVPDQAGVYASMARLCTFPGSSRTRQRDQLIPGLIPVKLVLEGLWKGAQNMCQAKFLERGVREMSKNGLLPDVIIYGSAINAVEKVWACEGDWKCLAALRMLKKVEVLALLEKDSGE